MKKWCLVLLYTVLASWPVAAADMPPVAKPKAVQPVRLVPECGSGGYLGINTMGAAGTISGSPVPGTSIVQGELGVTVGYTGTIGTCVAGAANPFWFVEGRFDFTNLNGNSNGLSLSGPIHLQQRLGYGNPAITSMLASIPGLGGFSTPTLPVLPTGVTSLTSVPYLYIAANEQDVSADFIGFTTGRVWEISPEFGIGMWNRLSNSVVVDVHAGYQIQAQGMCFGVPGMACAALGNRWTAGVSFNF